MKKKTKEIIDKMITSSSMRLMNERYCRHCHFNSITVSCKLDKIILFLTTSTI